MAGIRIIVSALGVLALCACAGRIGSMEEARQEPLYLGSASAPDRAPGEYIVTVAAGEGEELLQRQFHIYGIREIAVLGANTFLIKLRNDPGLEAVQRKAAESGKIRAVQPNYLYRGARYAGSARGQASAKR